MHANVLKTDFEPSGRGVALHRGPDAALCSWGRAEAGPKTLNAYGPVWTWEHSGGGMLTESINSSAQQSHLFNPECRSCRAEHSREGEPN